MDSALAFIESFAVVGVVYFAVGAGVAGVLYQDSRRASEPAPWSRRDWIIAVVLGPLTLLVLILERVIPGPPPGPPPPSAAPPSSGTRR